MTTGKIAYLRVFCAVLLVLISNQLCITQYIYVQATVRAQHAQLLSG